MTGSHAGYRRHGTAHDLLAACEELAYDLSEIKETLEKRLAGALIVGARDGVLDPKQVAEAWRYLVRAAGTLEDEVELLCSLCSEEARRVLKSGEGGE